MLHNSTIAVLSGRQLALGQVCHSLQWEFEVYEIARSPILLDDSSRGITCYVAGGRSSYRAPTTLVSIAAKESARLAVQHDPRSAEAHELLGRALWRLDEWEDGAESLREAVRLAPDRVEARLYLGEALQDMGEVEEARQELEAAVKLAPRDERVKSALERLGKKPSK